MHSSGKRLVVTGSSAGGIESLSRLLANLGPSFPAPIVVAQHLDPRVPSNLAVILAKHTAMNVVSVDDQEDMLPGTVYVVPANRHVEIHEGVVAVRSEGTARPKPSVDLLFATAARSYGSRLIAIVLTGMGSDGTAGARAVKDAGGTVMIEDPLTADFPSMPGSLPPSMVDIIAPIDHIGSELETLLNEDLDLGDDSDALAALLKRVQATSGIDFSHYKMPTIRRRLARQIKASGMKSFKAYAAHLDQTPHEYERLISSFLIKVTGFFRDPELFTWLQHNAIAELIAESRNRGNELRLWSAGCATGEEAYSLAIALVEVLGEKAGELRVRIFATDVDEAAIAFARHGVYPAHALTNLPADLMSRYFTVINEDAYEVSKRIRDMMVFGQHDLGQRAPFARIDLVLCRNVLIYFSRELQNRALQLFAFALRNGGYLALGKSEMTNPLPGNFDLVNPVLRVFRRFGDRVAIPATPPARLTLPPRTERIHHPSTAYRVAREGRLGENEEIASFIMGSSIGYVSVDVHYDITTINAAARQMLNIHGVGVGEDLIHLLPPTSGTELRGVLDAALHNQGANAGDVHVAEIDIPGNDELDLRSLTISCYHRPSPEAGASFGAVLLVVDVTQPVRARYVAECQVKEQLEELSQLRERDAQQRDRQRDLRDGNRKLAIANAELRTRSDELLMGAEEATASTEELETLNEEMQASNEELETLNEEYQATIEELNTTNSEVESRSSELHELVVVREAERYEALKSQALLQAMIDALPQAVAAVDSKGEVLAGNHQFGELRRMAGESGFEFVDESGKSTEFASLMLRIATGEVTTFSTCVSEPDASHLTYRVSGAALNGDSSGGRVMIFEVVS